MFKKYTHCPRIKGVPIVDYVHKLGWKMSDGTDFARHNAGMTLLQICDDLADLNYDVKKLPTNKRAVFLQALEYACEKLDMTEEKANVEKYDRFHRNFNAAKAAVGIPSGCHEAHQRFMRQETERLHQQMHDQAFQAHINFHHHGI